MKHKLYDEIIQFWVDQDQRELMPDRMTRIERLRAFLLIDQQKQQEITEPDDHQDPDLSDT
ncbi:MAG: hypothetical protein KDC35_10435 [Acidobacteria bacterium]|nr:hypothetical protein [Acidobacteriota bacterium]